MMIKPNSTILFQGDSITDSGRSYDTLLPNVHYGLGSGYVNLIAARLLRERPQDRLSFYNRGINGHRVVDLYARWKVDAINLKPDLLSILVGVNDTWHEFGGHNGVEPKRYEHVYRMMLAYTLEQLPGVQLVLCEPFVAVCGAVTKEWVPEIRQRQEIVRELSEEFRACLVPFQSAIDEAIDVCEPEYYLSDGVHPTTAGHQVLADCWIKTVASCSTGALV